MSKTVEHEQELERLAEELEKARERTRAVHRLNGTIADTMHSLAMDTAEIARRAFDWAESVEMLVAKSQRLGRELYYVRQQEEVDMPTLRLLEQQLRDAADEINIKIEHALDEDLEEARELGQSERHANELEARGEEDSRREREDRRRKAEDSRRDEEDARYSLEGDQ